MNLGYLSSNLRPSTVVLIKMTASGAIAVARACPVLPEPRVAQRYRDKYSAVAFGGNAMLCQHHGTRSCPGEEQNLPNQTLMLGDYDMAWAFYKERRPRVMRRTDLSAPSFPTQNCGLGPPDVPAGTVRFQEAQIIRMEEGQESCLFNSLLSWCRLSMGHPAPVLKSSCL